MAQAFPALKFIDRALGFLPAEVKAGADELSRVASKYERSGRQRSRGFIPRQQAPPSRRLIMTSVTSPRVKSESFSVFESDKFHLPKSPSRLV